jgi:regulator of RNase E activity RraA
VRNDDAHSFSAEDRVLVVALGSSAGNGLSRLREKVRSVIDDECRAPDCLVIDATGAAGVDAAALAGDVAAERLGLRHIAVACADAPDSAPTRTIAGVVVAPTVRQALEACRRHRYTS